jgi:ferredoxin
LIAPTTHVFASFASPWAFASKIVASWLAPLGVGVNSVLEAVFLLLNVAVIAGFLVFVSYSKHLHIFLAPINIGVSRRPRALGGLDKTPDMDMENVTEDTVFGAGKMEDFTWKQMLDFSTCTECGRCQSVCPAWTTGKPLSPKLLIMGLRDNMFASADRLLSGGSNADVATLVPTTIDPDVLWSCTTCGSLRRAVPRRHRARRRDHRHAPLRSDDGVALSHRSGTVASQHGEPGRPVGTGLVPAHQVARRPRLRGADHRRTDPRGHRVPLLGGLRRIARRARSQAGGLDGAHAAPRGVNFGILGPRESCTGDPARRMGNEYLFQEMAKANIATLE